MNTPSAGALGMAQQTSSAFASNKPDSLLSRTGSIRDCWYAYK
jgi:hypothetical protein